MIKYKMEILKIAMPLQEYLVGLHIYHESHNLFFVCFCCTLSCVQIVKANDYHNIHHLSYITIIISSLYDARNKLDTKSIFTTDLYSHRLCYIEMYIRYPFAQFVQHGNKCQNRTAMLYRLIENSIRLIFVPNITKVLLKLSLLQFP